MIDFLKHVRKWMTTAIIFFAVVFVVPLVFRPTVIRASAYGETESIEKYSVDVNIEKNRQIRFHEEITISYKQSHTMFYRSLPIDAYDRYFGFEASCPGNPDFSWYVEENPDVSGMLDVNLVGGAFRGTTRTYIIEYTMFSSEQTDDGLILDLIGTGFPMDIYDVDVVVHFPAQVNGYSLYTGAYGSNQQLDGNLSADRKTLSVHKDKLQKRYNNTFSEEMAEGITLQFKLETGGLNSFDSSQFIGTEKTTFAFLIIGTVLSVAVFLTCRKKRNVVKVVNLTAPQKMDPLEMGMLIDGTVDVEDITSMVYYFASKGYLTIDLSDKKKPVLIRSRKEADDLPKHQKVLLSGLFRIGNRVKVSDLQDNFYTSVERAKLLVRKRKGVKRFTKKSVLGLVACVLFSFLSAFLVPLLASIKLIQSIYLFGAVGVVAIALSVVLIYFAKSRRYKSDKRWFYRIALLVVLVLNGLIFPRIVGGYLLSQPERILLGLLPVVWTVLGAYSLSFTEEYVAILGDILGFKDFILFTEKDRIERMLEENPDFYYDVLPYAQVLGVTDEWEKKFKGIVSKPPSYVYGGNDLVDYMMFRHLMTSSLRSIATPPQTSGHSGGGTSFGGFSGGGHGGGGGGFR